MKYILMALIVATSAGCSAKRLILGEVAHQVIVCTSNTDCKERLTKDCPKGGVLHGIKQAVEIEYSCNK
jgi:hypothetical protein